MYFLTVRLTHCSASSVGSELKAYRTRPTGLLYQVSALFLSNPSAGSEWIISVGDYTDNLFTALGSSDPMEVRLEL